MRKQAMAHGLIPCPYCGGDIRDDPHGGRRLVCSGCRRTWPTDTDAEYNRAMQQLHPGNLDTRECPQCGAEMHWRDSAGLTSMHPDGAWECSNQRCWHMAAPGEMAPDTYQDPDAPGDFTLPEGFQ